MKIIALTVPGTATDPKKIGELGGEEDRTAWELSKTRIVREAVETALSRLPFYRHGFIRFALMSVRPFTNFGRVFS